MTAMLEMFVMLFVLDVVLPVLDTLRTLSQGSHI